MSPNPDDTAEEHRERMKQTKAIQDAEARKRTVSRGVVLVHTGDGKGKSTAGFGVVLRAVGHGQKVAVVQFIKGTWKTGEGNILNTLPGVTHVVSGNGFTWNSQDQAADIAAAAKGWEHARAFIEGGQHDVVVLDEVNVALSYGHLAVGPVVATLAAKPEHVSVVLTGRNAPQAVIDVADTVTVHQLVKHAYNAGVRARKGVEF
jgi:cob(I)alamin adenosyltransferase